MADLFQTSVSGLLAAQQALATTSHNISNANTDSYSRQRVEFGTRVPQLSGGSGYLGTGVNVETIQRVFNQSQLTSVQSNTSEYSRLDTFSQLSSRVDSLLADDSAGISPALQDFFGAAQQLAGDPTDSAARQDMLDKAKSLASRFHQLDQRLSEMESGVNQQLDGQVAEINQLADSIASLNQQIVVAQGKAQGQPANDLLDKRDSLLKQLSQRVKTRVVYQEDGSADVSIGKGDSLVTGAYASQLKVTANSYDPAQPEISLVGNNSTVNVTNNISGGSLGGLLDFRREVLYPTLDNLGRVATTVAATVNQQQNLGLQFDNGAPAFGSDFFTYAQPQVLPGQASTTPPSVTIDPTTVQNLQDSDFRLSYDGTNWTLTRLSDNSSQTLAGAPGGDVVYGMRIDTSGVAPAPAAGDNFLIRPTRAGADGIETNITRPGQIAAARALLSGEQTDSTGQSANTGTGAISDVTISNTTNLPLGGDITLTYNGTGFTVAGGPGGTVAYDLTANPQYETQGKPVTFAGYGGMTFTLTGKPDVGDTFVISDNTSSVGDNANALAMGALQNATTMDNGSSTLQESYSSLVGQIGNSTLRANTARDAQKSILDQAVSDQQSTSGVNLEEEAANMLKFQKAFQASAKSISIASTLFQSILSAVG